MSADAVTHQQAEDLVNFMREYFHVPGNFQLLIDYIAQQRAKEAQQRAKEAPQSVQGELDRIVGMIHETVNFLESCTVFVNSRERIKRPEGSDMWDQAMVDLATIASLIADLTPAQQSSDKGSGEVDERAEFERLAAIFGFRDFTRHSFEEPMSNVDRDFNRLYRVSQLRTGWENFKAARAALTAKVKP